MSTCSTEAASPSPSRREVRTTCPYCGVGCGVIAETDGQTILAVRGDPEHPANFGRLCSKGSSLHRTLLPQGRLLTPLLRRARTEARRPVDWEETYTELVERFATTIERHGPNAVAFYLSGQLLTEDYYVFNKLAKGLIGSNNVDTNSRLCMSSAVAGYKATLGADAPPACYEDLDHAELIVIAGSNMAWAHPVLYRRLEAARERRPEMKVVVIDPRRTETAAAADLHLPLLPGTDVALCNAVLHGLIWEDAIDHAYIAAHTEGFAELRASVRDCTPAWAARICGLPEASIRRFIELWKASRATLSLYCQGLNQSTSGSDKNIALIHLHLATGQIGKPGAGPFSLTGQPNAMGGREVGGLASLLPGHREISEPAHRAEIEAIWAVPPGRIAAEPGKPAVAMFEALARGEIKLIWIVCTNPAQSLPDQARVREALQKAECVIVQDIYAETETTAYADILLPATGWGEKEGTVTNSERRISRMRAALPAPGLARPDWAIAAEFGRRLAVRLSRESHLFDYPNVAAIFTEYQRCTQGRDLDISGLSLSDLDLMPQQWPLPAGATQGRARLYADGRFPTPNGRARFLATPYKAAAETVSVHYPLLLTTGRLRDAWHGQSRTGRSLQLAGHTPEPRLSLHADDALRRGIAEHSLVRVRSRRGELVLRCVFDERLRSGQCYLPMHWGGHYLLAGGALGINALTSPAVDARSFQPELKLSAVAVEPIDLPWSLEALALWPAEADAQALELAAALRAWAESAGASRLPYVCLHRLQGQAGGVRLEWAAEQALPASALAELDALLRLDGAEALDYRDTRSGFEQRLRLAEGGTLSALRLSGPSAILQGMGWLRDAGLNASSLAAHRLRLLGPRRTPPGPVSPRERLLCQCVQVSESKILEALNRAPSEHLPTRVAYAQAATGCGTQCGSCLPEVRELAKRLAASSVQAAE